MGYCWEGRKLICDLCSKAGARKVRCPFGYCPPTAACSECRKTKKEFFSKAFHRKHGCEENHNRFEREKAERAELIAKGEFVLSSGVGVDGNMVRATFESKGTGKFGLELLIPDDVYRHWPERPNPTLAWFEALAGHPFAEPAV